MEAGKLRHRVALQVRTRTSDGQGGYTETWATVTNGDVWAAIEPASSREVYLAQHLKQVVTHRVTLRYFAGVSTAWRIMFGTTRVFNVRSVLNADERNRMLTLLCEEGVVS